MGFQTSITISDSLHRYQITRWLWWYSLKTPPISSKNPKILLLCCHGFFRSRRSAAFIALCEKVYEHKILVILSNATKRRHSTQTEKARKGYARYIVAAKGSDGEKGNIAGSVSVTIEKKEDSASAAGLRSKDTNGAGGSFTEGHTTKSVRFLSQS